MDLSSVKEEQIVKVDNNTLVKYHVVEERIDIGDLKLEKLSIEEQLKQPTDEELLEWARANYPAREIDRVKLEERLAVINSLLGVK